MHTEVKTVHQGIEQVSHTVAKDTIEHDVKTVSSTSCDDVTYRSPVTSSDDKCNHQVLTRPPANLTNLPSWIYCTRYTDRPPGKLLENDLGW